MKRQNKKKSDKTWKDVDTTINKKVKQTKFKCSGTK